MRFYRWRIVLLSLGVLLGYGSAVRHFMHPNEHCRHYLHAPEPNSDHDTPPKKVP